MARCWTFIAAALVLCVASSSRAQESAKEPPEESKRKADVAAALEKMKALELRPALAEEPIKLIDRPLLTFGDSARKHENGTLWAWGETGRPVAFLELWKGGEGAAWGHGATLTSHEKVMMKTPVEATWIPESFQIEFAPIPNAPAPAAKETQRLRQIKDLSRRFTAHEHWDNERHELRLLVQPVWRYVDEKKQIHDGAVFVIAHGTNPEILLLIEAQGKSVETAAWKFALARTASAELHVLIDDKEVWKADRAPGIVGRARDPYWLFFTPAELEVE